MYPIGYESQLLWERLAAGEPGGKQEGLSTGDCFDPIQKMGREISGQFLTNEVGFCRFVQVETTRNQ